MTGLSAEQLASFEKDGYLIVENVLSEEDLAGLESEYREIVDRVAKDPVKTREDGGFDG